MVVSNIFYFHPYLGKISNLTNIFEMGWNYQPENHVEMMSKQLSIIIVETTAIFFSDQFWDIPKWI